MPERHFPTIALLAAAALCGCSPTLSSMQPARLVPAGHLAMSTSVEASLPGGEMSAAIERARALSGADALDADDVGVLADAASSALIHAPGAGFQISAAYGLSRYVELDARVAVTSVRGGVRFQLIRARPGIYLAVGLGVTHHFFGLPLADFTSDVELHGFSRQELDVPLTFGFSSTAFHVWLGPKIVLARFDADVRACLDRQDGRCAMPATMQLDGRAVYLAGQLGFAVGWKRVWLTAELTVAHLGVDATMLIESDVRRGERSFAGSGIVLAPAVGLLAWF